LLVEYNESKGYLKIQERLMHMDLAKISANGQITVPVEIRRLLGLKPGDKILFLQKPNGEIVVSNASAQAIYKAQRAFAGVAEDIGVYNEDDVQDLVNEVRYGKDK
jgi:antitoxin PrlF